MPPAAKLTVYSTQILWHAYAQQQHSPQVQMVHFICVTFSSRRQTLRMFSVWHAQAFTCMLLPALLSCSPPSIRQQQVDEVFAVSSCYGCAQIHSTQPKAAAAAVLNSQAATGSHPSTLVPLYSPHNHSWPPACMPLMPTILLLCMQLLSSLVDAAERLRTFSPVKEQLSTAVLEEVRFRLYRIVSASHACHAGLGLGNRPQDSSRSAGSVVRTL